MAYTIAKATREFREVCAKAGVNAMHVPVYENARLTRTLGRVHLRKEPVYGVWYASKVEFSSQLLKTASDKSIKDVIMHEAAHLIATERTGADHKHDYYFKAVCAEIGTDNDGTCTTVEKNEEYADVSTTKYDVYCPTCDVKIGGYSRMCKTLKNINYCTCKRCGNSGLKVVQNW